jgi:hypothetical protein
MWLQELCRLQFDQKVPWIYLVTNLIGSDDAQAGAEQQVDWVVGWVIGRVCGGNRNNVDASEECKRK